MPVSSPPTNQLPFCPIETGSSEGAAETPVSSPSMYQCPFGPISTREPSSPAAETPVSFPSTNQLPFAPISTPLPHAVKANRQTRQSAVISRMRSFLFIAVCLPEKSPRAAKGPSGAAYREYSTSAARLQGRKLCVPAENARLFSLRAERRDPTKGAAPFAPAARLPRGPFLPKKKARRGGRAKGSYRRVRGKEAPSAGRGGKGALRTEARSGTRRRRAGRGRRSSAARTARRSGRSRPGARGGRC